MRKYQHYTLYIIITAIIFSLITVNNNISNNIVNVSALSYSNEVGIGFTFNPTISVSLSSSDLTIQELSLGTTGTSNEINVLVTTNASYGYTLSATVGNNSTYNSDGLINNVDNDKVFSNIAVDADLSSLNNSTSTNIWGYSYKDNTVDTPTWSNYNGLSLYSSTNPTTLLDLNSNTPTGTSSLDFKIAAKASPTQPSGEYSNIINFMAVSKVGTVSLLDAFVASNATMQNGYYTMQGMTPAICNAATIGSSLQLLDIRDNKLYWVAKLADNNCWMTQNLDLDLDSDRTYTHWDTDLGWGDPDNLDANATWKPDNPTIDFTTAGINGWDLTNTLPYSASPGDIYFYTSNSDANDIQYNSLRECVNAGHDDCTHYHVGNYYNWTAAVASNNTSNITSGNTPNSICSSGWKLPTAPPNPSEFEYLLRAYDIIDNKSVYLAYGFDNIRKAPLYFVRGGLIGSSLRNFRQAGYYWMGKGSTESAFGLIFTKSNTSPSRYDYNGDGRSVRCLAR